MKAKFLLTLCVLFLTGAISGQVVPVDLSQGQIREPFVLDKEGGLRQTVATDLQNAGRATFRFTITNAGEYVLQGRFRPVATENSVYLNVDREPAESNLWIIATESGTTAVVTQNLNWVGQNTTRFQLSAGEHELHVAGKTADTCLLGASFVRGGRPQAPRNLQIVPGTQRSGAASSQGVSSVVAATAAKRS